jgi:hypothetical protein
MSTQTGEAKNRLAHSTSFARIVMFSALAASFVFLTAVVLQWAIYDDWLHHTGPVRLVGTSIAAVLTFAFVCKWLLYERARHAEMLKRFQVIAQMNDKIRNAVQLIACTDYVYHPDATDNVRKAVDVIDQELRGVVETIASESNARPQIEQSRAQHAKP